MKFGLKHSTRSLVAGALLAACVAAPAVAAPCSGLCEVTVGNSSIRVEASRPELTDDGFGFKTKYLGGDVMPLPLNGGLTQWQVNGRNLMFAESFWYRIGPASPTNPEHYWVDATGPIEGTQEVLPGGTVGRIAAGTEGGLPRPGGVVMNGLWDVTNTPNGSLINEKLQLVNVTSQPLLITLFAYSDLDLSTLGMADSGSGRLDGGNARIVQIDDTGRRKVSITGMGASGFELMYLGGRTVENGGAPHLLDLLNRPELAADFLNTAPQDKPWPADLTHVIQWSNIELPAFGSREIALVKEFTVSEPGTLGLLLAPVVAGLMATRRRLTLA